MSGYQNLNSQIDFVEKELKEFHAIAENSLPSSKIQSSPRFGYGITPSVSAIQLKARKQYIKYIWKKYLDLNLAYVNDHGYKSLNWDSIKEKHFEVLSEIEKYFP